jgi:hypothetical protein
MHASYSSDELKALARTLGDILVEARTLRPDLSTDDVVQHVCALADDGERDAKNLHIAVLSSEQFSKALAI